MSEWWTQPSAGPLELIAEAEPERFDLRARGEVVATISDQSGRPLVTTGGSAWRMVSYAGGWRYAFIDETRGATVAWYDGGGGLGVGRIVIAPDREYRLRPRLVRGGWRLAEDRATLATFEIPRPGVVAVTVRALPTAAVDGALVLLIGCAVVVRQTLAPTGGGGGGDGG